jgi:beta-N-acetylglucosaminidase
VNFKKFYRYNSVNLDLINKAFFEECRDYFSTKKNKKSINEIFLLTDEQLEENGFFKKFPHLK